MKLFVGVLLTAFVAINGAAIDSSEIAADEPISRFIVAPTMLFEKAWTYQNKLQALQSEINEKLTAVRTSVSTVLSSSTNVTLEQIESNAHGILVLDEPARDAIYALGSTPCVTNLKVLLNGVTEFTGFGSANCVSSYDKSTQGALTTAYALLQKYEGAYGDVQQIVVRSFIGNNVFLDSEKIEATIKKRFEDREAEWEAIRPDVEDFVKTLQSNIAVFNTALGDCFSVIQSDAAPGYAKLHSEIATCEVFDNTADPFAAFR